jgi:phosphatidylinositol alpha-1,6-mannosyltransferase
LFITRKYPPSVGGMELFAFDLSQALAAKVDLRLVKWSGAGRLRAVLFALPYLFIRAFWTMFKGVDVIYAQDGVLAPPAYVLSRLFRKPYTVQIHGLDATYKNPLFRGVVPRAIRKADTVFCISHAAAMELTKLGVDRDKIKVIPLAVNDVIYGKADRKTLLSKLDLPADSQILLTVGRLIERKGVAWFIDNVLPELVKNHPKLIYLVIGEGEHRPSIQTAIDNQKLNKHVRLLGKVDEALRVAAYNGADVFVMPNINVPGDMEGFGLVLLEAALCALPIVASDTEGIKDAIVSGQNGLLVPVRDVKAFAVAIKRLLNNSDYAKQLGQASRQHTLNNYAWGKLADEYITTYMDI